MSFRLSAEAEGDIRDIYRDGALRFGLNQADIFLDRLFASFDLVARFPAAGRPTRLKDLRSFPVPPYSVLYAGKGDSMLITRILDARSAAFAKLAP